MKKLIIIIEKTCSEYFKLTFTLIHILLKKTWVCKSIDFTVQV